MGVLRTFERSIEDPDFWKFRPKRQEGTRAKVKEVAFALLSASEIRRRSVGEVTTATLDERGYPKTGGPNDLRMGPMNRTQLCHTCGKDFLHCQGHFMHIELPLPVLNLSFVPLISRVLRCLCFNCMRLRGSKETVGLILERDRAGVWQTHWNRDLVRISDVLRKRASCERCGAPCPDVTNKGCTISWIWRPGQLETLAQMHAADPEATFVPPGVSVTPPMARARGVIDNAFIMNTLLAVRGEDFRTLGLDVRASHPANAVMEALLVPPPCVRPAIRYSESNKHRSEHNFTSWIQDILRAKAKLERLISPKGQPGDRTVGIRQATQAARNRRNNRSSEELIRHQFEELSGIICGFINSESSAARSSANARHCPAQSNRQSLLTVQSGKTGQWRANTQGKRINYTGRTIACPTVALDPNELGFPHLFGLTLTHRTRVQPYNIEGMRERVRRGDGRLDGAVSVELPDGTSIALCMLDRAQLETLAVELVPSVVVEHPMENGHHVIQNRQPTLRCASMMAHQVFHERDSKVQRVNTAIVQASNTDFDGDALNSIKPQTELARAETQELMAVGKHIVSTQSHEPLFGLIQDSILAAFRLTEDSVRVGVQQAMQCVCQARHEGPVERLVRRHLSGAGPRAFVTGKELASTLFPDGFHFRQTVQSEAGPQEVEIVDGVLVKGRLCKRTLGATSRGIVHSLERVCGETATLRFLGDSQRVLGWWLSQNAVTIGIEECLFDPASAARSQAIVEAALEQADAAVDQTDAEVAAGLRQVLAKVGTIAVQGPSSNSGFKDIVQSGAKGIVVNLAQVLCCVGQQSTSDPRIGTADKRTLSCFPHPTPERPNSARARGFVASGFGRGLTPAEVWFHCMATWDALEKTTGSVRESGYDQRKMAKAAEGVTLC